MFVGSYFFFLARSLMHKIIEKHKIGHNMSIGHFCEIVTGTFQTIFATTFGPIDS